MGYILCIQYLRTVRRPPFPAFGVVARSTRAFDGTMGSTRVSNRVHAAGRNRDRTFELQASTFNPGNKQAGQGRRAAGLGAIDGVQRMLCR